MQSLHLSYSLAPGIPVVNISRLDTIAGETSETSAHAGLLFIKTCFGLPDSDTSG
jgi:tRNA A37 threonylcarbamoyladenosine modification protein TsaB